MYHTYCRFFRFEGTHSNLEMFLFHFSLHHLLRSWTNSTLLPVAKRVSIEVDHELLNARYLYVRSWIASAIQLDQHVFCPSPPPLTQYPGLILANSPTLGVSYCRGSVSWTWWRRRAVDECGQGCRRWSHVSRGHVSQEVWGDQAPPPVQLAHEEAVVVHLAVHQQQVARAEPQLHLAVHVRAQLLNADGIALKQSNL